MQGQYKKEKAQDIVGIRDTRKESEFEDQDDQRTLGI